MLVLAYKSQLMRVKVTWNGFASACCFALPDHSWNHKWLEIAWNVSSSYVLLILQEFQGDNWLKSLSICCAECPWLISLLPCSPTLPKWWFTWANSCSLWLHWGLVPIHRGVWNEVCLEWTVHAVSFSFRHSFPHPQTLSTCTW